uniref:Uncharacterized protein n=1 Tax=Anopheles stephensi TaxID=30069 RepID=A0A182XZI4_ANOST
MEIANHRNEGRATTVSQRQTQPQQLYLSKAADTNADGGGERQSHLTGAAGLAVKTSTTNIISTNLKYLHKKFKRIASATLTEEEEPQQQVVVAATTTSSTTTSTSTSTTTIIGNGRNGHEVDDVASADQLPVVVSTCSINSFPLADQTSQRSHELSTVNASVSVAERITSDRVADESSQVVTVKADCGNDTEGSDRVLCVRSITSSVPSDKFGPPPTSDRGTALIGITAAYDYHQQQQQQYHQLHPSLHPGVAAIASFPPQSLLVHPHHQLLFGHHSQDPPLAQQQLQHRTSANNIISSCSSSSTSISSNSSSSSSKSVSTNISNNNAGGASSKHGAVLLPTVLCSPSSELLSAKTDNNCNLSVASSAALPNRTIEKSAGLQYVVSYSALQQHHHPSALLYANGGGSTSTRPHQPGLSSSSGGSSGSPSPPTAVSGAKLNSNITSNSSSATIISTNHVSTTVVSNSGSSVVTVTPTGRYVCPYCQMNCSKPSVLEKHIRRHTNERPFNSRAHASKSQGEDTAGLSVLDEDGGSLVGSDIDDKDLSNSGSEIMNYRGSPMDDRVNSPQQLLLEKPYKPKFHNAAFYTRFDNKPHVGLVGGSTPGIQQPVGPSTIVGSSNNGQNVESLEQHISKLISQNEAIVEVVEAPLQKKYHKITGISRGISVSGSSTTPTTSASFSTMMNDVSDVSVMQHAAANQDSASSRVANVVHQKQRHEEIQDLQPPQQDQEHQTYPLHAPQQHHYLSYVRHQQHAMPNVINLTNKPIVTPKSMVALQQQQLVSTPGSTIALGSVLPAVGTHIQQSHQLSNIPENILLSGSNSSSMVDGAIHFQPLNLTKANTAESVHATSGASIPSPAAITSSSLLVAVPSSTPTPVEESSVSIQQNLPLPPYRKRTRELSPVIVANNSSGPAAHVSLVTVCTTTTTSVTTVSTIASQPPHIPLHIQVSTAPSTQIVPTDRPHRPTATPTPPLTVANHPQNPERSIIKDLLLNSRGFGVVQNPDGENGENLYTCKMCNVSFRDVDSLKYHMICYCQGSGSSLNSPSATSSAPISPIGSPSAAAASYIRSRSVSSLKNLARSSLNPPVGRSPSSLSKLAKSQLTRPKIKPENISLSTINDSLPSCSSQTVVSASGSKNGATEAVQNPLPSPGPLLGNTRLVESGKSPRKINSNVDSNEGTSKRTRVVMIGTSTSEAIVSSACGPNASSNRQLFGGGEEAVERTHSQECDSKMTETTETIAMHCYGTGGTYMQYNSGVEVEDDESLQRELQFRHTLRSGGALVEIAKPAEIPSKARARSNAVVTVAPKAAIAPSTHFHFPPINSITAYNPLTLPAVPAPGQASQIVHGGKLIPFVQGIPGPNTLTSVNPQMELMTPTRTSHSGTSTQSLLTIMVPVSSGSNTTDTVMNLESSSMFYKPHQAVSSSLLATVGSRGPNIISSGEQPQPPVEQPKNTIPSKNGLMRSQIWSPAKQQSLDFSSPSPPAPKKSFNFTRMADNISPRKKDITLASKADEVRHFHFDTVIAKSDIMIKPPPPPPPPAASTSQDGSTACGLDHSTGPSPKPNRFLRPNTLPLKPGTFTPKRHHGITPTNNTMPLISPETPRPSKSCRELYFNGHAYTNIGLKSSTKPFYCTVNKTQPFYFQTSKQLSMYSNWQVHPENDPHPLGLKQVTVLSLYDSNQHRDRRYAIAGSKTTPFTVVNSNSSKNSDQLTCSSSSSSSCDIKVRISPVEVNSNVPCPPAYVLATLASHQPSNPTQPATASCISSFDNHCRSQSPHSEKSKQLEVPTGCDTGDVGGSFSRHASRSASAERALSGGFESTEEYTYVRGRGRGKYVCNECGIRCKKPSMLKKHIRTHTDVRPYSCQYCSFHFKTKGNLTKHMKSKSHFKKCTELGLNPVPVLLDDDGADIDIDGDQLSISSERTSTIPGDSDTASDTDGDDTDDSDEVKSRLPEHEAAEGLLSLSMTRPTSACSSTGQQPGVLGGGGEPEAAAAYITQHINSYLTPDQQQRHGYSSSPPIARAPQTASSIRSCAAKTDPPRRIITYGGGPKLEFNLLKHEQYYSDPNVGKRRRDCDRNFSSASDEAAAQAGDADDEDDTARPIDLTKKTRLLPVQPIVSAQHQYDRAPLQPLAMVTPLQLQPPPVSVYLPTAHDRCDRDQMLQQSAAVYENRRHAQQQQQQVIVRVSDVLAPISDTANLLTTLVSNTDKIPLVMGPFEPTGGATPGGAGVDENAYFHEYLKERALQDTRIKQSQMKPNTSSSIVMRDTRIQDPLSNPVRQIVSHYHEEVTSDAPQTTIPIIAAKVTKPPEVIPQSVLGATIPTSANNASNPAVSSVASVATTTTTERVYRIFSGKNERHRSSPLATETVESKSPAVTMELDKEKSSGQITVSTVTSTNDSAIKMSSECPLVSENASPMDTLAEIAAGSLKLDVSRAQPVFESESLVTSRPRCNSTNSTNPKPTVPAVPESAKTLASEYLKLAQAVTNVRKRTESESALGTLGAMPSTDQELPVGGSDGTTTPVPIVVSPASQQQQHASAGGNLLAPATSTVSGQAMAAAPQAGGSSEACAAGSIVAPARKVVVVGEEGFKTSGVRGSATEFVGTPTSAFTPMHQEDGGRPVCEICNKKFHKLSQLSIHMNIHYMERKYRCEPCGTSFRSQGLYLKHERSATHRNKVSMTTTFGVATDSNPRPFYCRDCEVGFRIHGHLAKHLRSKMHVLKLECLGKLPFGTYTEIERSGTNLTEIDTSDCENSLSMMVNGTNTVAEQDDDQLNINNNVKRKSEAGKGSDYDLATEPKRARYAANLERDLTPSAHSLSVEGAANGSC